MQTTKLRRGERLAQEVRSAMRGIMRRLRLETPTSEFNGPQLAVLHALELHDAATTADLARAEMITPQAMGVLVAELEAAGCVARTPDPADGRRWRLSLTAAGQRAIASGRNLRQSWLARAIELELSDDEQRLLTQALPLLQRLVVVQLPPATERA